MDHKTCSTCGESKPLDEFGRLRASRDGRAYLCNDCKKKANRAAYLANAEARKAYQKKYYEQHREHASAQKKEYNARNKEKIAADRAAYYRAHREEKKAYAKRWRSEHPEYQPAYNRKYAKENADRISAQGKRYREANRASIREYLRRYHEEHAEKYKALDSKRKLAKYGLTKKLFGEILAAQGGRCLVCDAPPGAKRFSVDHEHVPGYADLSAEEKRKYIRGLLCDPCNRMIGLFKESAKVLQAAAVYLRRNGKRAVA